ncbi:MAG: DNA primase [Actinobacteria bacterium]|nr:MAG: DNA primase [Actinomycetota bacterium]
MARQTTGQRDAAESAAEESERPAGVDELWSAVRIDPVEIALPKGVGYTLRAYRPVTEVTPTDISEREEDAFPERARPASEDQPGNGYADEYDEEDDEDEDYDEDDGFEAEEDEDDEDELDEAELDEEEEAAAAEPEEVPVFLGRAGLVYLFRSPEGLVDFVKSGAVHDLSQLDTWSELTGKLSADDVVPLPEDTYELDLVVDNLRGSRETWDANLVIQAGEVARDLGYALRIEPVIAALAPGSPLDDLDEALRATEGGGLGGFMARRRLKKIGAEAAPLGWRTIIGKISSAVDWRD